MKYRQRQARIELGIIERTALQPSILIVLDQVVIRIARKSQRIKTQRIDCRQLQQAKGRCSGSEVRQIKVDQVMTQQE